jgi:hypothetical protein
MITLRALLVIGSFFGLGSLCASQQTDLASSSQAIRDTAAKAMRASYRPSSRTNWDSLVASIRVGDIRKEIDKRLRLLKITPGGVDMGPSAHAEGYRLDDRWVLICEYDPFGNLLERKLDEDTRRVWVEPPPKFSGIWTTYYVNGQKRDAIDYKDGKYNGEFTSFRADGSKSVVQHYGPDGVEGEDTGYFPSGRVSYRGVYKAGRQVGTWTWFNEDGTARNSHDHGKP